MGIDPPILGFEAMNREAALARIKKAERRVAELEAEIQALRDFILSQPLSREQYADFRRIPAAALKPSAQGEE